MAYRTTRQVEWGDCDAAGIVFYPNYLRWMDATLHVLLASFGFSQRTLPGDVAATPLVDVDATFHGPVTYGDTLDIDVAVTRIGTTGFGLTYAFHRGPTLVAEGHEHRVCIRRAADAIETVAIPETLRTALEAHLA